MTEFLPLQPARHRVAIAGKVVDARSSRPIAGAVAVIASGPAAFQRWLAIREKQSGARWSDVAARPDRAVTADDGCFCFIDLPDGLYTIAFSGPPELRHGTAQQDFVVQRDSQGDIAVSIEQIALPPTGARGVVKALDTSEPLSLARVRVEGSEEAAYSDASGLFVVSGVQPGARRLSISASGYHRGVAAAQITTGEIIDVGTILLQPAGA
jgi:hypothetical protein